MRLVALLRKATSMATRTIETTVSFASTFFLNGFDTPQPAGDYRVDHDEESIEGPSMFAWRRVGTFIHLPAIAKRGSTRQMVPVNAADLQAALDKDTTDHASNP